MLKRALKVLPALAIVAVLAPKAATAQMMGNEGEEVTIVGTVVDLDCKFRWGQSGDGHRMCAQVCADNGLPLAILGNDGKLYMPVGGGMPGESQNARLKEFAEQEVTIIGTAYEAGGAMALEIGTITGS